MNKWFKKITTSVMVGLLAFTNMFSAIPLTQVYAEGAGATGTVTEYHKIVTDVGTCGYFNVNGKMAFCAEHEKTSVPKGTALTSIGNSGVTENMRKILYYGYGGPEDQTKNWDTDTAIATTEIALSAANGHTSNANARSFLSAISKYSVPSEDEFQVTLWKASNPNLQTLATWTYTPKPKEGYAHLTKVSSSDLVKDNPDYSLEGAEYGIYSNKDNRDIKHLIGVFHIDAKGSSEIATLKPGIYYVTETKAPKGFKLSNEVFTVKVNANETTEIKAIENPQSGNAGITKVSSNPDISMDNDCYSLEGAEYRVYEDLECTKEVTTYSDEDMTKPCKLVTDKNGLISKFYLPYGYYYLKEIKAPKGFFINESVVGFEMSANSQNIEVKDTPGNDPFNIFLKKKDKETVKGNPLCGAKLEGAEYTIKYYDTSVYNISDLKDRKPKYTYIFKTDKDGFISLQDPIYQIGGDRVKIEDGHRVFPLGTYVAQETKAPEGYLINKEEYLFNTNIDDLHKNVYTTNTPTKQTSCLEQVRRGDYTFTKKDYKGRALKNVKFNLTNVETGETHTIISDNNGVVTTGLKGEKNPKDETTDIIYGHSYNTNRGTSWKDGVWFGKDSKVNDDMGALPYGTYKVTELPCSGNNYGKDLEMVEFEFKLDPKGVRENKQSTSVDKTNYKEYSEWLYEKKSGNNYMLNGGTVIDERKANESYSIKSRVFNPEYTPDAENAVRTVKKAEHQRVYDEIEWNFDNATRTNFILKSVVMDKTTGEPCENFETIEQEIDTKGISNGTVTVKWEDVDLSNLDGKDYVVFEYLIDKDTKKVLATDADYAHTKQTFNTLSVQSSAKSLSTKTHIGNSTKKTDKIADTLNFYGFADGKKYTVKPYLIVYDLSDIEANRISIPADKEGEVLNAKNVKIMDGKKNITSSGVFTAKDGAKIDVEYEVNTDEVKGKAVICCADVYDGSNLVLSHVCTGDYSQEVLYPELKTYTYVADNTNSGVNPLSFFEPKAFGEKNINKDIENTKGSEEKGTENKVVEGGQENVDRTKDVNLEKIMQQINDRVNKTIPKSGKVKIYDIVKYTPCNLSALLTEWNSKSGLHDGTEKNHFDIDIVGTLMDKETKKALVDEKGNEIKGHLVNVEDVNSYNTSFVKNGYAIIEFEVDATELSGKELVAFEEMNVIEKKEKESDSFEEVNKTTVAEHKDFESPEQSIYTPSIHTTAKDAETNTKQVTHSKETKIIDTVKYHNLIVGKTYEMTGILMDKETGKPLKDKKDKEITAKTEFTPIEKDGSVDVEFIFSTTDLKATDIVAFEKCFSEGDLVCTHTDLEDENQTTHKGELHTTATDVKSNSKQITHSKKAQIKDIVEYKNLTVGEKYKVVGKLMDKETKEALKDKEGKEITAETEFEAEKPNGKVEVIFNFDATLLKGQDIVVFEDCYLNDKLVCTHSDIEDGSQTTHKAEIHTTAKVDGKKVFNVSDKTKVVDTVEYKNLTVGEKYVVNGVLMDKKTKQPLKDEYGKEITGKTEFTAKKSNGKVDVEFIFDTSKLKDGQEVTVFEELKNVETNCLVAEHKDIEDKNQTVTAKIPPVPEKPQKPNTSINKHAPKTGDIVLGGLIVAGVAGAGLIGHSIRNKRKADEDEE